MKVQYALVAALLAGALSVPAFAGVTDTNGGKIIINAPVITGHTTVQGTADRYNRVSEETSSYSTSQSATGFPRMDGHAGDASVLNAISSVKSSLFSYIEAGRANDAGILAEYVSSEGVTSHDIQSKTNDVYSEGAILIGDPDDLEHAYAAKGTVTRNTKVDEYITYQINVKGTVSPIVLDLDGDGSIQASNGKYLPHGDSFDANGFVMFDFHGNGFPVASEWVGKGDGLLCRPNADGSVQGPNLFGTSNGFENGFDELASLDVNNDGQISGAELEGLMIWEDSNRNGSAEASELKSVQSLGISSISVNHNNLVGSFVRNGQTFKSFDWWPSVVDCRKVDMARR